MLTGQKIAKLRLEQNLTQEQLAEKLFVSRELVSKWETNKRAPDYKIILKLAEILCVEPDIIANQNDIMLSELSSCIPSNILDDKKALTVLINQFLSTLNERERCVFVRRYYYFEETFEIAEEYRIKEGYVRTVLMRTRKKLAKFLKEMQL